MPVFCDKFRAMKPKIFRRFNFFFPLIVVTLAVSAVAGGLAGYWAVKNGLLAGTANIVSVSEEQAVVEVVRKAAPAVVSIVATKDLPIIEQRLIDPFGGLLDDPFFRQFFGDDFDFRVPQYEQKGTQKTEVSSGSGFLISSDGLILTNKHVIDIAGAEFTVILNDGRKLPVQILAKDPVLDLAIMKIDGADFSFLSLGDSDNLQIGQTVIAIGNALGEFRNTVSKGVISGLSRSIVASSARGSEKLDRVIQTDAAINRGNSGGPLLNLKGEVIGVNTAVAVGAQNIGFALPINQAKRDVEEVRLHGRILDELK